MKEELLEITYIEEKVNSTMERLIEDVVNECFVEEELMLANVYISIILTNPKTIKQMNNEYRNIDKETDVLSFPMFEKNEIEKLKTKKKVAKEPLGDIVISINRVKEQAQEYEHSFERELAYMVVHGFYHLMGYDHMTEEEKTEMREKEENILSKIGIGRE